MEAINHDSALTKRLRGRRIFIASNRGPAQFYQRDGRFIARQSSGGLATALVSAAGQADLTWVAVAGTSIERQAFAENPKRVITVDKTRVQVRYVPVPDATYKQFYDDISNNVLWFVQHYLLQSADVTPSFGPKLRAAWEDGYVVVNRAVADALIHELRALPVDEQRRAIVMIQDYHLYLVPGMLRAELPDVVMTHFVHIPWPTVRYWDFLPQDIVTEIFTSMLHNDVVGVQTEADVTPFLMGAQKTLPDAALQIAGQAMTLHRQGHTTLTQAYPIAIDPTHVNHIAHSRAAHQSFASIARFFDRQTILRVDRLEPTKNIVRGLQAFDLLLEQHGELRDKVRFVMILVPSREHVWRYRQYAREVRRLTNQINAKYASKDDPVVVAIQGNDQARALAAMRRADVMLVNSIIDGMHLGAKEFAAVNETNGILVISRTAGVAEELGKEAALIVAPLDVQETATELYDALMMNDKQKDMLFRQAHQKTNAHTVIDWLNDQLNDAIRVTEHHQWGASDLVRQEQAILQPVISGDEIETSIELLF